jgi:hypothetical protein
MNKFALKLEKIDWVLKSQSNVIPKTRDIGNSHLQGEGED